MSERRSSHPDPIVAGVRDWGDYDEHDHREGRNTCPKCKDTGWRLLPSIDPVEALPCDRCPQGDDPEPDFLRVLVAHGYTSDPEPDDADQRRGPAPCYDGRLHDGEGGWSDCPDCDGQGIFGLDLGEYWGECATCDGWGRLPDSPNYQPTGASDE